MTKIKENSFSLQWEEEELSLRINVHKDWLRDHSSRAPYGIRMMIRGILKSWFLISLHQGTLSILCSRIQAYMLSLMNEVDSCLLLPLCVLYEMQNQIFQQWVLELGFQYHACITCNWVLELKKNHFLVVFSFCSKIFAYLYSWNPNVFRLEVFYMFFELITLDWF